MLEAWQADWKRTSVFMRILLCVLTAIFLYCLVMMPINETQSNPYFKRQSAVDYWGIAEFELLVLYLGATTLVWPFWLARAVRKRGSTHFNFWLIFSMVFTIPSVIVYWAGWSHKGVIPDEQPKFGPPFGS